MTYFLLADGFEETEAIAPFDMVKRAGEDAVFVSVSNNKTVTGAHGIKIVADIFMNEISAENGKMIVLPGEDWTMTQRCTRGNQIFSTLCP